MHATILGTGNSACAGDSPILVLFRPGAIMLVELETEPEGSISHGETLPCLFESTSPHLTCRIVPNIIRKLDVLMTGKFYRKSQDCDASKMYA